jgi:hypothetical protein
MQGGGDQTWRERKENPFLVEEQKNVELKKAENMKWI